jgi:hypothetical protein
VRSVILSLALIVALVSQSKAAVIFDNFGVGDTYNKTSSRSTTLTGSPLVDHDLAQAFRFSGNSAQLDTIRLALQLVGGANALDVYLMGDNWVGNKAMGTNPSLLFAPDSGNVLESFHLTGAMTSVSGGSIVTINSVLHPILSPDTYYWLVISTPAVNGHVRWWGAPEELEPKPALFAERDSGNPDPLWEVNLSPSGPGFAFRIEATAVPEPTSLVSLLGGLIAIAAAYSRRTARSAAWRPRA